MRKIILLCVLAIGMMADAQTVQTIAKPLKLNIVAAGTSADSVLVRGADKIVKFIPRSKFGTIPTLEQVLTKGNTAVGDFEIIMKNVPGQFTQWESTFSAGMWRMWNKVNNRLMLYQADYIQLNNYETFGSNQLSFYTNSANNCQFSFPKKPTGDYILATTEDVSSNARPYKSYTAILTQSGTASPSAIVLENTLGENITWSYESNGNFKGTKDTPFNSQKTYIVIGQTNFAGTGTLARIADFSGSNQIQLISFSHTTGYDNNLINSTSIEIRVYN